MTAAETAPATCGHCGYTNQHAPYCITVVGAMVAELNGDTQDDDEHCGNDCGGTYEDGERVEDPEYCVHCDCCCGCLGCIYAPRDGMLLSEEQRAPIAAFAESTRGDKPEATR